MDMRKRKRELESWLNDKSVQDNITESWLCVDCGVNTHPGCSSGPETRIELALTGKSEVSFDRQTEVYHVRDSIWNQAGMRPWNGCLCIGCLEKRLGRQLRPRDFAPHDHVWSEMPSTERLLNRRGFATVTVRTKDGDTKEIICDIKDAVAFEGALMDETKFE
jgi:hypothetical protein